MRLTPSAIPGALLLAALLLTGCEDPTPDEQADRPDPATTEVSVHFRDSSVPPEYHRSWKLTLDQDRIHLVVDSYGDVVARESAKMPAKQWESFVADLPADVEALGDPEEPEEGCAGGNGIELEATGGADLSFDLDNCDTEDGDETLDEVERMVEPFTDLVHLDKHTRT